MIVIKVTHGAAGKTLETLEPPTLVLCFHRALNMKHDTGLNRPTFNNHMIRTSNRVCEQCLVQPFLCLFQSLLDNALSDYENSLSRLTISFWNGLHKAPKVCRLYLKAWSEPGLAPEAC